MNNSVKIKKGKKIAAIGAAAVILFGMIAQPVLAATIYNEGTGKGVAISSDTTLNIPKTVKVTNPALIKVAGPGLQLAYSIAPAEVEEGTTVTDGTYTESVQPGPADGLRLTTSPSFPVSDLLDAAASGANYAKNIVLTTDLTKFTDPGIYRYALTDTTTAEALAAAGVDRSEAFDDVRYIDVYIQNAQGGGLVVEGYVVGSDADENGILAKETFDTSTPVEEGTPADTRDVFNTYNVKLTKNVSGEMGAKHHPFPFEVDITDGGRVVYAAKGTAPSDAADTTAYTSATEIETRLMHGESYYIGGLRKNDTVSYTETNDTDDTYLVSVQGTDGVTPGNVAPGGVKTMPAKAAPGIADVTFDNNLHSISPTGVVTRFGPYIGMILIAAVLVIVRKKANSRG